MLSNFKICDCSFPEHFFLLVTCSVCENNYIATARVIGYDPVIVLLCNHSDFSMVATFMRSGSLLKLTRVLG